jgi:DNA (cytosine-5)-methyltransferase 1
MGIRDAKHSVTFRGILARFKELKLTAGVADHSALDYGVPQTRNRVIISGSRARPRPEPSSQRQSLARKST